MFAARWPRFDQLGQQAGLQVRKQKCHPSALKSDYRVADHHSPCGLELLNRLIDISYLERHVVVAASGLREKLRHRTVGTGGLDKLQPGIVANAHKSHPHSLGRIVERESSFLKLEHLCVLCNNPFQAWNYDPHMVQAVPP